MIARLLLGFAFGYGLWLAGFRLGRASERRRWARDLAAQAIALAAGIDVIIQDSAISDLSRDPGWPQRVRRCSLVGACDN